MIFFLFSSFFQRLKTLSRGGDAVKKNTRTTNMSSFPTVKTSSSVVRLFLAGDFMPGRGIDAVMPRPCPLEIREGFCASSIEYARLAERKHKKRFPGENQQTKLSARDVLGEASKLIERYEPHVKLINLETSVTKKSTFYPNKGINYRASEENVFALFDILKPNVVSLANNHAMDFSREGLEDTLQFFDDEKVRVKRIGAGWNNIADAMQPAVLKNVYPYGFAPARNDKRGVDVAAFGLCFEDSGVPRDWEATERSMGVVLATRDDKVPERLLSAIAKLKKESNAIIIVSIHFGGNWGFEVPRTHVAAAKTLVDAGADVIHGHSSHHAKTAMLYKEKLILFGCGEFFNDYEGIRPHAGFPENEYLGHLRLLYFVDVDAKTHNFNRLEIVLMRQKMFALTTLERPREEAEQLLTALRRQYAFGRLNLTLKEDGNTLIAWPEHVVKDKSVSR